MKIDKLSLDEKLGQRFIFGVNSKNTNEIIKLVENAKIGGVILYKKNYKTYEEMLELIKKIKKANRKNKIPLFISIDQEGGRVNRLPNEIHNIRNIYDVSKTDPTLIKRHAQITSKILIESGINMDFAPVLDITSKSKALYKRCFYGDEKDVAQYGKKYIKEFKNNKVVSVPKHFPGHGASTKDSHINPPYISNFDTILTKHIKPYETVLKHTDAVMVGHLVVRWITHRLPASISDKFLTDYLRNQYKFEGLIITDEINMLKRSYLYRFTFLHRALTSSSDIILVKIKNAKEGYNIINKYKKIHDINKLNDSVNRIIQIKEKYQINDKIRNLGTNIEEVNQMIDNLNSKIL